MKCLGVIFTSLFLMLDLSAQTMLGPFAGAVTDNSAEFIVKTYKPQRVKIELFTQAELEKTLYTEEYESSDSNYNYIKISASGMKPNTEYFYRSVVDGVPSKKWHSFKTFPSEKNVSFSFGFGSCQQSGYAPWDPEIFPVIAHDTLRFFIQIGDWTYPDSTEKKYGYRFNQRMDLLEKSYQSKYNYNYPFVSEVLSQMPVVSVYDDHDFAANDPDGTTPDKENSINAYKMFFPHYPLPNADNGIWQKFSFGDAEFFIIDVRSQRRSGSDGGRRSMLNGFDIQGENQTDWLLKSLSESKAKWKVLVSPVVFNPAYAKASDNEVIKEKYPWLAKDPKDKWAGYPEEVNRIVNTVISKNIKNVIVISGDTHSSYIDNGTNSIFPEISASNLDVPNSLLAPKMAEGGLKIWSEGSYDGKGHTYGKVSFIYGEEDYALLEIIDEKGETAVKYKLSAK